MDAAVAIVRAQRALVALAVVLSAVVIHITDGDIFALPKATVIVLCAVFIVALTVMRWAWSRTAAFPVDAAAIAAMAFVVALGVTTITSTTPSQSVVGQYSQFAGLVSYTAYVVLFVAVLRTHSANTLPSLVRAFVGAAVVVVGYALVQVLDADPVDWALQGRVVGTLGNPNFLAGWVGIVLPLAAWAALHRGHHVAWRAAGAAVALAIPIVALRTDSFQGPVTVAASAAALALFAVRIPRRWLLGGAAALAIVLVVLAPRIRSELENGLLEREHFWSVAVEVAREHPIVGTGPDTFHNQFLPRRPAEHSAIPASQNAGAAHNVPLDHLAGSGALGAIPYLAFVAIVGWRLVRGLRATEGDRHLLLAAVGAAWVGYQVQSLVSIDKPPLALAHFVLAGAVLVASGPQRWLDAALPGAGVPRGSDDVPAATWVVSAVVVVVGLVGAWVVLQPLRADILYARGVDALQRGDASGIPDIERSIDLAPWEATYTFELVRGRLATQDVDGALRAAEEGADREPGDGSYALVVAQIATQVGRDELAVEWFEEALRRDPYGLEILGEAAKQAALAGDRARMEEMIDRALEVTSDRWDVWADVYAARAAAGDEAGADEAREQALARNPEARLQEARR